MATDTGQVAVLMQSQIRKWEAGRTPADGDPDEIVLLNQWQELDGTVITDPERIAELEARLARQHEQEL